jgi:hypothetical protein
MCKFYNRKLAFPVVDLLLYNASTEVAKPRAGDLGGLPQKILNSQMHRGVFPPSQKLKDIPTKCTFWVNFVGKTIRSHKKERGLSLVV